MLLFFIFILFYSGFWTENKSSFLFKPEVFRFFFFGSLFQQPRMQLANVYDKQTLIGYITSLTNQIHLGNNSAGQRLRRNTGMLKYVGELTLVGHANSLATFDYR